MVIFALTFVFLALLTHDVVFLAGNDASRFAQVEALVDEGETQIDRSRYRWTVDRVALDGKSYSNKPPLLSILVAGVYWLLQALLGLSFAHREAATVYLLTLLTTGGVTAWLTARFYTALGAHEGTSETVRVLTTLALAAGTILTSFSTTLNNHTIAAALVFAACHAAWTGRGWAAGIWIGLAACIDIVPGLVFAPVVALMLFDSVGRVGLRRLAVSLAGAALLFVAANAWIVGSPLPPKMVSGAVDQSSRFASSAGGVLLPDHWTYPLECLLGWHGFFSVSPVLLFGAAGLVAALRGRGPLRRRWSVALGLACGVMIAGHVLLVGSYGGWSYGFRYLIPIVPILLFFAPPLLNRRWLPVFGGLLAVSVLFALIGAYHPWPPGYEQEANQDPVAATVVNPVGGNLAAWSQQHFPGSALAARSGDRFISSDAAARARYLQLFYTSKRDDPALYLAAGVRPAVEPDGAKVLADTGGSIARALLLVSSPKRSTLRNQELVQNVARRMGPDARLLLLADPEMILDPNPQPDRMQFVGVPDELSFSIWPQDPFVVLRDDRGESRLLTSRDYGRMEDREMARVVADALGWPVEESSLFFAGGNVLADERHAFVGADLIRANQDGASERRVVERFQRELGRPVIVVGTAPQAVAHIDLMLTPLGRGRVALGDPARGADLAEQALAADAAAVRAFEEHAELYFFGHPELRSLTGPGGRVIHAPAIQGRTADAIADSRRIAPALEAVARDLTGRGYEVLRVPLLLTRLDRPEHRRGPGESAGYPVLSYNNVLIERVGDTRRVYMPVYGLAALDEAAHRAWTVAGFEPRTIPGVTTSAMYRGSLRCSVKILERR